MRIAYQELQAKFEKDMEVGKDQLRYCASSLITVERDLCYSAGKADRITQHRNKTLLQQEFLRIQHGCAMDYARLVLSMIACGEVCEHPQEHALRVAGLAHIRLKKPDMFDRAQTVASVIEGGFDVRKCLPIHQIVQGSRLFLTKTMERLIDEEKRLQSND